MAVKSFSVCPSCHGTKIGKVTSDGEDSLPCLVCRGKGVVGDIEYFGVVCKTAEENFQDHNRSDVKGNQ